MGSEIGRRLGSSSGGKTTPKPDPGSTASPGTKGLLPTWGSDGKLIPTNVGAASLQGVRNGVGVATENLKFAIEVAEKQAQKTSEDLQGVLASLKVVIDDDRHGYAGEIKFLIGAFIEAQEALIVNLRKKAKPAIVDNILNPLGLRHAKPDGSDSSSMSDVAERLNAVLGNIGDIIKKLEKQSESIAGDSDSVLSILRELGEAHNKTLNDSLEKTKNIFNNIAQDDDVRNPSIQGIIKQLRSISEDNIERIKALLI